MVRFTVFKKIILLIPALLIIGVTRSDSPSGAYKINTKDHYNYIAANQCLMWVSNNGDGSHDPRTGQKVRTLINEDHLPGDYKVVFDATGLSSGIYFYRLAVLTDSFGRSDKIKPGGYCQTKK